MISLKRTIYFLIIIFLLVISGLQIVFSSLFVSAASLVPKDSIGQLDISQDKIQQKYQKAEKIKQEYKIQKASFIKEAKDENAIQMEIGNKTKDEFVPEMTIRKWDDEVNFNIKYKHNVAKEDQSMELDGEKIKWKNHKTEVHFYEMEDITFTELDSNGKEHIVSQKELFEFDIILNEKPATNVVELEIETKGLSFYYQPELTQEEKNDGAFRPENVVGSYAVYHESKQGDYSKMGGKNYMAGKAFHIYRPKIFDAEGTEIWGQLNINEEEGILSIEVPQGFWDNAVYPVRVDPTFGYMGNGETYGGTINGEMSGSLFTGAVGIVTQISAYMWWNYTTAPAKCGIYKHSDNSKLAETNINYVSQHSSVEWVDFTFTSNPTIEAIDYVLVGNGYNVNPGPKAMYYDSGEANQGYYQDIDQMTLPTTANFIHNNNKYSIYCTYKDYSAMTSDNYTIQSDSINFGGGRASSTSYVMEDTFGEIATGVSTSSSYNLYAGYQQMYETYISMTSVADVTLTPAIGGVTGGTANGSTTVTVTTDSVAGYELSIKASSSPALSSVLDNFSDYTTATTGVPDFVFTIPATSSEFGFSPEGVDIYSKYKDNGSLCNTGSGDTSDRCWESLSTTYELISKSTTANHPNGVQTTIKFRAQSGSSHIQIAGDYTATTTITAIAL